MILSAEIGSPSQVRDRIGAQLPRDRLGQTASVIVDACDERGRQCSAFRAHHYRIHAFYVSSGEPLDTLAEALSGIPGVYEVHQVRDGRFGNLRDLRVQVIALIGSERG